MNARNARTKASWPGWLLAACLGLLVQISAQAQSSEPDPFELLEPEGQAPARVVHVLIQGQINVGQQALLSRAVRETTSRDTLVIELDTPGGAIDTMWEIAQVVDGANQRGTRTVAWINPMASSAGSYIAMSCDELYMVKHGTIGSAMPIMVTPVGSPIEIPEDIREKQMSQLRASFRSWAEAHNYPPALAEAMVDRDVEVVRIYEQGFGERNVTLQEFQNLRTNPDVEVSRMGVVCAAGTLLNLTSSEAVELEFAHGVRESLKEVVDKLGMGDAELVTLSPTRSEDLAAFLDTIHWMLFVGGLLLAYAEFKMPGFGIPGIAAIVCFAVLLLGRHLVGLADVPHLVAVVAGLILIAGELFFFPGMIWPGLLGAICLVGGLVMANVGPTSGLRYELGRKMLLDESFNSMVGFGVALLCMGLMSRVLPKTPVGRAMILKPTGGASGQVSSARSAAMPETGLAEQHTGRSGLAVSDLRPVGKVQLDGVDHEFEASSNGPAIERQQRVRVVEVRAGRLVVELEMQKEQAS